MSDLPDEQLFARLIAEHLASHRSRRGLSKLALAQRAGLDQRTITFIEEGVNVPSVVTLFVICRAMEVNVATVVANAAKGKPPSKRKISETAQKKEVSPKKRKRPKDA